MRLLGAIHRPAPPAVRPLATRARLSAMAVPAAADWFAKCPADGLLLGNDFCGDCVPVADYRVIQVRRANVWGEVWQIPPTAPVERYTALTGYNMATGIPDDGTMTDVDMAAWCSKGIRIDSQNLDVPAWATVDPADDGHLAIAIAHTGPVLVTLALPLDAEDLTTWALPPAPGLGGVANGWGEHRVLVGAFDGAERVCRTWGKDVAIHPDWWRAYALAVDVVLSREWLGATGIAPSGLDWVALAGDMAHLAA